MKSFYLIFLLLCFSVIQAQNKSTFSFALVADMRNFSGDKAEYFRGACESISKYKDISFMISPGDIDPPDSVYYTIRKYLNPKMVWYPVVGNHEAETASDMNWLRNYNKGGRLLPNIVNSGPASCSETNYSFDYQNTHFVILNQYSTESCDNCTKGDVPDFLYNWLKDDLLKTKMENVLVIGHEPAYPLPDIENQRFRHVDDCLNQYPENRDRFVKLLQEKKVKAYVYGHTHNYIVVKINKLWHVDVGHSRGTGDPGARSTYLIMNVKGNLISYITYRLNGKTRSYEIADSGDLN